MMQTALWQLYDVNNACIMHMGTMQVLTVSNLEAFSHPENFDISNSMKKKKNLYAETTRAASSADG